MYKTFIRSLLFILPPETIHHLIIRNLKRIYKYKAIRNFISKRLNYQNDELKVYCMGIEFGSPVGLAAGFDKEALVYDELSMFGFSYIEIGTITPVAQPGNEKPRLFRLKKDKALINRMGFNNPGIEAAKNNLKRNDSRIVIGGNIGKNTITKNENAYEDYLRCFEELYDSVDYFVVNVSCPNIGDLTQLQDKGTLEKILNVIVEKRKTMPKEKAVLLKISPDLNNRQIDEVLDIVQKTGIDGIVATNTTTHRNNLKTGSSVINKIGNGGLSGTPIKDRSTEIISYIRQKTSGRLLVIGVGGIMTPEDAREKLMAGAKLVQVYTGFIYEGPAMVKRINKELARDLSWKS